MALANVAWILAGNGKKVLLIDWDLEAPGLHRYLHPFLRDKELVATEGLIDFVVQYANRAVIKVEKKKKNWYVPYADILHYATSLDYPFKKGTVDFVPAGRQGPDYATRVNSFNWQHLYERLDGGMFFEAAKESMAGYDYVLIDSRTGVSDTSGICTVQMPDVLVVCFTLNTQSIEGAAAVAESADAQRRNPLGKPTLKIFPVPTRVELTEQGKLKSAREVARERFNPFLRHLRDKRDAYWEGVEVLYQPFYAYEEILAVFGDSPGEASSMLSAMETLTGYLSGSKTPLRMPVLSQAERDVELAKYSREPQTALPNLLRRLQGHTGGVRTISLSPNGRFVLSGSEDTTLKLWDFTSGEILRTLSGHEDAVQSVAFSSDGEMGVSGSNDNTIIVWNLSTGKIVKRLMGHSAPVHSVAVSADGKFVLSGSADNSVILWDFNTGQQLKIFQGHSGAVATVAISSDGTFGISGGYDRIIVLWDLIKGRTLRTFSGHTREVTSVSLSRDGQRLLSGSGDQNLMLWDIESGRLIRNLRSHTGKVYAVDMSSDGRYAVSGSADRTVLLWDLETLDVLRRFEGHSKPVNAVKLSTDSRSAISASDDGSMVAWDLSGAITEEVKDKTIGVPSPIAVTPGVSKPAKLAERDYYLSFARADADKYFQQFVSDLSQEMSLIRNEPISLLQDLSIGESWSDSLRNAVRTCKVAICILTPSYFRSESCGKEYEIFRRRGLRVKGDGIFPITWLPIYDIPVPMVDLQRFLKDVPQVYNDEGLAYLMRLSRYRDEYQVVIKIFAQQLHDIALNHPLPELTRMPPSDQIPNAFRVKGPAQPLGAVGIGPGPFEVSFIFAAETPFGTPLREIATEVASNLRLFASFGSPREKMLISDLVMSAGINRILIITVGPESRAVLDRLSQSIQKVDASHCALLLLGDVEPEPSTRASLAYVGSHIQSESSFRYHIERAIVRIRQSMILKSSSAPATGGSQSYPSLPST